MCAILDAAVFTSIALSANSESPFGATDKTLMMAFVAAAGAGTLQRQRRLNSSDKIGRASCRERVLILGDTGVMDRKKDNEDELIPRDEDEVSTADSTA